ncbi:hypothetical protein OIDMADRAFT_17989 [Oidiodendron maius Zn]|uniref:Uncharacterized protein n=1 Tax=Oidiodendron maius (strain Zn) TaxID=913774 RepID=A0A0C3DNT4_OIDMZ|nr:hypothetical protein OIDMADRAFT_17989 [Oidiodendron maius Zn]
MSHWGWRRSPLPYPHLARSFLLGTVHWRSELPHVPQFLFSYVWQLLLIRFISLLGYFWEFIAETRFHTIA